jgi:hypothetical protein
VNGVSRSRAGSVDREDIGEHVVHDERFFADVGAR